MFDLCAVYSAAPCVGTTTCMEFSNHSYPTANYHRLELVISSKISDILFVRTWNMDALFLPGRASLAPISTCDSSAVERARVKLIRLAVSDVKILAILKSKTSSKLGFFQNTPSAVNLIT